MADDKTVYHVLYSQDFNTNESSVRKKLDSIIDDLKQNKHTNQGKVKLIKGNKGVKYFRAKLNDSDRLLFTTTKYHGQDALIILELILNHDYGKSKYLNDGEKIKNIRTLDYLDGQTIPNIDDVELRYSPKMRWLGKFLTFDDRQDDIVENLDGHYNLPLIVIGHAGSGKTSVALEKLRKLEDQCEDGKILFITQSENLSKKSKQLYDYEHWHESKLITNVRERVEFTHVHEFITLKIAKINEKMATLVEGKRPITRNEFFSWFGQQCEKGKFKKYKNQGDKIYEEFTAVIAGGNLAAEGGESKYIDLGLRQSIFAKEERKKIYNFFEQYKQFVGNHWRYYDSSLIAAECLEIINQLYDVIIIDEVQDLTKNTLNMILASLKDQCKNNFLLCGDVNQVIHPSFFSISKLKNFLAQNLPNNNQVLKICPLEENYRNSRRIINLANRILHLKNYCFSAAEDKMAPEKNSFFMKTATAKRGQVRILTDENVDQIEIITENVKKSINWAPLILLENHRQNAEQRFGNQHVFSVQEAKGLEFENVVLYMFDEAYDKIWGTVCASKKSKDIKRTVDEIRSSYDQRKVIYSRVSDKEDRSFEENKFFINALYVAVTRAIDKVFIFSQTGSELDHPLLQVLKDEQDEHQASSSSIQIEESSADKWKEEAIKLIDNGATRQAKNIAISLLCSANCCYSKIIALKLLEKEEFGFVDEILNELKHKGYHDEFEKLHSILMHLKSKRDYPQSSALSKPTTHKIQTSKPTNDLKVNSYLFEIICNDKVNKFKKLYPQFRHSRQEIWNLASEKRSLKIVDYLLANFTPKIGEDFIADTKLPFQAALSGFKNILDFLLARGANINATDEKGNTLLHVATIQGRENIVKLLLDGGANIHATNHRTAMVQAGENNWKLLTHEGTELGGYTALHMAAQTNHIAICKLLLSRGADAKAEENRSFTPLKLAIFHGHKIIVEYLLDYECEVANTETPQCVDDYLYLAAQQGHVEIAELLLSKRPRINIDAKYKTLTPLVMAAQLGHAAMCDFLLKKGADINAKESRSMTALHIAALRGHTDVVRVCLNRGADVDAQTSQGCTALRVAVEADHLDVARLLLDRGADVNTRVKIRRECSPLHVAARMRRMHMAELLLDRGADIHIADKAGMIPLHLAVCDGDYNMVAFFIGRGVDTTKAAYNGCNALYMATIEGHHSIVKLLRQAEERNTPKLA